MNALGYGIVAITIALLGLLGSAAIPRVAGRTLGFAAVGISGVCALLAAATAFATGGVTVFGWPLIHVALRMDATAAFFVGTIGVAALLTGVYGVGGRSEDERRTGRTASAGACAVLLASLLACLANDVWLFIFAWELLALAFYWTIGYAGNAEDGPDAAYVTLVVTHVAGALMVGALLFLAGRAGDASPDAVVAATSSLAPGVVGLLLVLMLCGFGAKIGMLPLQAWMPYGYGTAPSVVAALMAGGAINVGFYGLFRFVLPVATIPVWFAIIAVGVGAVSAFFGIAWGTGQNDIRRLAAYSSVENAGVILAALGVALAGRATHAPLMVGLGVAAAALQMVAHALAKTTLFLTCATLGDRASRSLTKLGGLAKSMPITTIAALTSALSLAALPPLAGFASEWFVLEALMQAFRTRNLALEVGLALSAALIGVAAGVAIVAFTKYVGVGLLGAPRSARAAGARETESWWQRAGMLLGACAILAGGLAAPQLLNAIAPMINGIAGVDATSGITHVAPLLQPVFAGFSSASPLGLGIVIAVFALLLWVAVRFIARPKQRDVAVWTSGESYRPWTQYTGTGYVNATRAILDVGLRTEREIESGSFSGPTHYRSAIRPFFSLPLYRRIGAFALRIADAVRLTQSGIIAAYLSYILVFALVLILLYPSLRHW